LGKAKELSEMMGREREDSGSPEYQNVVGNERMIPGGTKSRQK
jgi:hypothetical protein